MHNNGIATATEEEFKSYIHTECEIQQSNVISINLFCLVELLK